METPKPIQNLDKAREFAFRLVKDSFKNDYGLPFEMTPSQCDIFLLIFLRLFPRNSLLTYTQFGKTDVVSMALIMRTQAFKDTFTIVAGKKNKGMLIMNKVIQHVFDNEKFYSKLEIDKEFPLERLRRERSKEKVTWLGGGGIRVLSAQSGNKNTIKEALIGEGGQNIIEEEAPHIPDNLHAMVMRMMIGHQDSFLLKIGNAFNRNHYFRSHNSGKYATVTVDYHKGIEEGRITMEQIDEVKYLPFFSELYECKFPGEDDITEDGYRKLIPDEVLNKAFISEEEFQRDYCTKEITLSNGTKTRVPEGRPKLGADFAGGGSDRSAYVIRWPKVMKILSTNKLASTMQQVPIIEEYMEDYSIEDMDVAMDTGGLGQGVGDRMVEKDYDVLCVMFGESAPNEAKSKHKNYRAFIYWELSEWLLKGGKIVRDDDFNELLVINYKVDSERKFQIQPKEELKKMMREQGISATSPDIADAAALTFANSDEYVDEDDVDIA